MESSPIRVLLIDDNEDDYILTVELLAGVAGRRYEFDWKQTYQAALEAMLQNEHDVYLVDYRLDQANGLELLREAVANGCTGPIILLTGLGSQEVDLAAMKHGAVDYLDKQRMDAVLLDRSIRYAIERRKMETARARAMARAEAAEAASRVKSEFLSMISHELKTPLTSIIGFSEVLAECRIGPLNEQQNDCMKRIARSGHRLLSLVERILELSRIGAEELTLDLTELDVEQVLANCLNVFASRAEEQQIELRMELECRPCLIMGDAMWFSHLLENLVGNAIKFSPHGGTVTLQAERAAGAAGGAIPEQAAISSDAEAASWTQISVADTGIGIAQVDQERIFELFKQIDSATDRHFEGAGVGLTLCKKIVERHGGQIWVDSKPGKGSVFCFTVLSAATSGRGK